MTINVTALMRVRQLLGWSTKAVEFEGGTLVDLLKGIKTQDGASLHDFFIEKDGRVSPEFAVWLNCRPIKPEDRLEIPLQSGDRLVAMPALKFRAGG